MNEQELLEKILTLKTESLLMKTRELAFCEKMLTRVKHMETMCIRLQKLNFQLMANQCTNPGGTVDGICPLKY